jgi:hypothetical protein
MTFWRQTLLPTLSLFASAGTLVCCALPALFVSLGLGAVLAGLVTDLPWLIWMSEQKAAVFGAAAGLLAVAGFLQWRARFAPCPADPVQAAACTRLRRLSLGIYLFSVVVFAVGFFFAFVAVYLR